MRSASRRAQPQPPRPPAAPQTRPRPCVVRSYPLRATPLSSVCRPARRPKPQPQSLPSAPASSPAKARRNPCAASKLLTTPLSPACSPRPRPKDRPPRAENQPKSAEAKSRNGPSRPTTSPQPLPSWSRAKRSYLVPQRCHRAPPPTAQTTGPQRPPRARRSSRPSPDRSPQDAPAPGGRLSRRCQPPCEWDPASPARPQCRPP
jgi:hypothetical protein